MKKDKKTEAAEKKYRTLIEGRNKLNDEANALKEERNTLNTKKSEMIKEIDEFKVQRN